MDHKNHKNYICICPAPTIQTIWTDKLCGHALCTIALVCLWTWLLYTSKNGWHRPFAQYQTNSQIYKSILKIVRDEIFRFQVLWELTDIGPIQRLFTMALTLSKGWTKSGKILVECDQFLWNQPHISGILGVWHHVTSNTPISWINYKKLFFIERIFRFSCICPKNE